MNKEWYKSKAMWSGIAMAAIAIVDALGVPIPKEVYGVLAGLGIIGVRQAQK